MITLILTIAFPIHIMATSMKMDFLPLGNVRTDPIISATCLSDHVHTFYGAKQMRPEITYEDLIGTNENSGNVKENKSLYWHPTVYRYDPDTGIYETVDIYFSTAYYIWTTGEARAFPDGFKMIAGVDGDPLARAEAECVGESECERSNCETTSDFFPGSACAELEVSMAFPTCWDGINLDSEDHQSHVSYDTEGGIFDGDCPATHPIKLPEIQFFFRIIEYTGGQHLFADGTDFYHSDYFSGWNEKELQNVLDNCENYSDAASPDAWCEDILTFRDAPKEFGEDSNIVKKLKPLQPKVPFDTSTITDESITKISSIPQGQCNGILKPKESTPTPAPTPSNDDDKECKDKSNWKFTPNRGKQRKCSWFKKKPSKRCKKAGALQNCPVSCNVCAKTGVEVCEDFNLKKKACKAVDCCRWDKNDRSCVSNAGDGQCL